MLFQDIATAVAFIAVGAFWRRVLGGLFHLRRTFIVAAYPVVTILLWFWLPWQAAAFACMYRLRADTIIQ